MGSVCRVLQAAAASDMRGFWVLTVSALPVSQSVHSDAAMQLVIAHSHAITRVRHTLARGRVTQCVTSVVPALAT